MLLFVIGCKGTKIDEIYDTIEHICWRINTNFLSLHQRKEKE